MKDYSPLFNQGLLALASDAHTFLRCAPTPPPIQVSIPPLSTKPAAKSRAVVGRSFLNFNAAASVYILDDESVRRRSAVPMSAAPTTSTFSTRSTSPPAPPKHSSASSSSPTSRALPLPKPAPVSSLPAIPIAVTPSSQSSSSSSARPHSPTPSSTIQPSPSHHRKHHSMSSGSVSTSYRKKRRADALHALEGKHQRPSTAPTPRSFVPRIDEEADDSTSSHTRAAPSSNSRAQLRSHLSFGSSMYPGVRSPTAPAPALSPPPPPRTSVIRRASAPNDVNFIDLDDDAASSVWRWSTAVA